MKPIQEEPTLPSSRQEVLVEALRPTQLEAVDLEPRPITFQDVRPYLHAAGEEERELIRVELFPDTQEATAQVAMCPGRRSFPAQTPPPTFTMSDNPEGNVSIEHSAKHIWTLLFTETRL